MFVKKLISILPIFISVHLLAQVNSSDSFKAQEFLSFVNEFINLNSDTLLKGNPYRQEYTIRFVVPSLFADPKFHFYRKIDKSLIEKDTSTITIKNLHSVGKGKVFNFRSQYSKPIITTLDTGYYGNQNDSFLAIASTPTIWTSHIKANYIIFKHEKENLQLPILWSQTAVGGTPFYDKQAIVSYKGYR
jgi:hypothetical protein